MIPISYKLAKQLKDAGFPQRDEVTVCQHENEIKDIDDAMLHSLADDCLLASVPTLSELTGAVMEYRNGEGFKLSLQYIEAGGKWWAEIFDFGWLKIQVSALTAEEAMANLYLAINKK